MEYAKGPDWFPYFRCGGLPKTSRTPSEPRIMGYVMSKWALSERDICSQFITPALRIASWDELQQVREEVSFTKGRITPPAGTCNTRCKMACEAG